MIMKQRLSITLLITLAVALAMHAEGWIRINQLGYLPDAVKVAVLMSDDKVAVTGFELVDAYTGKTAYRSTATRDMGPWGQMQATCRLDFSDFHGEGAFRIVAAGISSPVFPINNRVFQPSCIF